MQSATQLSKCISFLLALRQALKDGESLYQRLHRIRTGSYLPSGFVYFHNVRIIAHGRKVSSSMCSDLVSRLLIGCSDREGAAPGFPSCNAWNLAHSPLVAGS